MSIVEFRGGPISHRYLMNKSKADLAYLYLSLLDIYYRDVEPKPENCLRGEFRYHNAHVDKLVSPAEVIRAGMKKLIDGIPDEDIIRANRIEIIGSKYTD